MRADLRLVRAGDWWDDKIPHLIAVAALGITISDPAPAAAMLDLGLFLVSAAGIASFGHVLNDHADVEVDRAAGKVTAVGMLPPSLRRMLLGICLLVGLVPWCWLPTTAVALTLLAVEVALLSAYSLPPLRLKQRAGAGVVADAAYAYAVPMMLAVAVFFQHDGGVPWWGLPLVGSLGLLMGLRGILWHQVLDEAGDREAGVRSLVTLVGPGRALWLADRLAPIEVVALTVAVVAAAVSAASPVLVISCALYVPFRLFAVQSLHQYPLAPGAWRRPGNLSLLLGYGVVSGVVGRWLPLAALAALAWGEPVWWIPVIVYVVAFDNVLTPTLRSGGRSPFRALLAAVVEPFARSMTREVERSRRRSNAALHHGATIEPAVERRWVFVVCGDAEHLNAVRNAVRHLRPLSQHEIWMVTDSTRNRAVLDDGLLDAVVDVRTPADLDDHQASIWLKTSVHRHVPPGLWCYLDSDIVAAGAGVDEVFEHLDGPVAFASDLPLAGNTVDHFSPHAMTCDCRADVVRRCGHLREQLTVRLGVTVPGSWCHWNGGVFVFGDEATELLDRWHALAVASFDWPEWRTRDQGALIASVWQLGLQDTPRLGQEFNFIVADPWENNIYVDSTKGWALSPTGPWIRPRMLHLFQPGLDDPLWELARDVELPLIRRMLRERCVETLWRWRGEFISWCTRTYWIVRSASVRAAWRLFWGVRVAVGNWVRAAYWSVRTKFERYAYRAARLPQRLRPGRLAASLRRRVGRSPQG